MPYRGRWDHAANPKGLKEYPVAAATVIAVGDLCIWDPVTLKILPASSTTLWGSNEATSRVNLADKFVGIAHSAHAAAGDEGDMVRVGGRGVYSMPVGTAVAFEIGDWVGGDKDSGGNFLYAQSVEKVTVHDEAIGLVVRRYAAATGIVEFEIKGLHELGGGQRQFLTS